MKSRLFIFILLLSSTTLGFGQELEQWKQIQQILDKGVEDKQFAGGVVGLSVGEKEIVVTGGYKDLKRKIPFERTTLNRIASIAKPMTAIAALQLYEQGKLDLDVPIATYLPNYPKRHASRITTRQLLLHSSGIGAYQSSKEAQTEKEYATLTEAATVFQDRDLVDEPGKAEHYTTYGYVVLGMVIEAVSGQSYEEYMKEHIWKVAGMDQTGVERFNKIYDNKSKFYRRTKRGRIKSGDANNLSNRVPGGGLHATVDDLLKFGKAVLNHQLISAETFAMMTQAPGLPYEGNPYGMGWFLYGENPDLGQVYGHTGGQTGCSAVLLLMPQQQASLVVMSNTSRALDHVFGMALEVFPTIKALREN